MPTEEDFATLVARVDELERTLAELQSAQAPADGVHPKLPEDEFHLPPEAPTI